LGTATVVPNETGLMGAIGLMLSRSMWAGFLFLPTLGILYFPDGRLPSPRWRWAAVSAVVAVVGLVLGYAWEARPWSDVPLLQDAADQSTVLGNVLGTFFFIIMIAAVASLASLIVRYRRSRGETRLQIRWMLFGFAAFVVANFFPRDYTSDLSFVLNMVGLGALGLAYGVALTKYRLYDVDVFISKTVLYGLLAAFIGGVYALLVVGVGSWIGAGTSSQGLSIVATALVAVAFEPVRSFVQRFANRLVYGRRATPYQVLSDLTARLASAESMEGLMERIVQRLADGTGAVRSTIRLEGAQEPIAVWPPGVDERAAGEEEFTSEIRGTEGTLGHLSVAKARGQTLTPSDKRVVEDLAGSAAMVLSKVRLDGDLAARARDLRESRRRMVDAQGEEQRRLERDLHDGAQQQIVALKVKLGLAERFARDEGSDGTAKLIAQMADDAQQAIEEIRSLAKGIFPPLLEVEGLTAALATGAANAPVPVIVEADGLERMSVDVEAAAYFCISEAITNAVKYSGAHQIDVYLGNADGNGLRFSVRDDGSGFDPGEVSEGSGVVGMRDRLEALGGSLSVESSPGEGTTVSGFVPGEPVD
jgi:signal transduction histidine kinase